MDHSSSTMGYNISPVYNSSRHNETLLDDIAEHKQIPVIYIVMLGVLIVAGGAGNSIVISSVTKRNFRTPVHMLVVNLAIIDAIICLVQIPLTVVNIFLGYMDNVSCVLTGILGTLLFNYSVQIQCLILYSHVRIVTSSLHLKALAVTWRRIGCCTTLLLVTGLFLAIFPSLKFGYIRYVAAVGYCFFVYDHMPLAQTLFLILYTVQLLLIVFLCCFFRLRISRYIKKYSARQELANQRHAVLFRMMIRKLIIWTACYSLLLITRYAHARGIAWHDMIYKVSYFLVWTNSLLNPVIQIFSKSTRMTYNFCFCRRMNLNVNRINVVPLTPCSTGVQN